MSTYTLFSNTKWNKASFRVLLAKTGRLFMLLVFLLSLIGGSVTSVKAQTATFTGGELLGKPTDTSITINIIPNNTIEYYYEYGTASGVYTAGQTTPVTAVGGQPHEVTITGLDPDTRYYYRMIYDADGNLGNGYEVRDEHTFHTQRAGGESLYLQ